MTVTLATIHTAAADLIDRVGWTQRTDRDDKGRVCLTGALRHCRPQPGDWQLARGVYRAFGHGENWNDDRDRTAVEVVAYLRDHPVTDEALAAAYGPQWEAVVALVRRAATITSGEAELIGSVWLAAWRDAESAAAALLQPTRKADRAERCFATGEVAGDAVRDVARGAAVDAWFAVTSTARALAVRDLLLATPAGTEHYKTITRAWAGTVGPAHPDDDKDRDL